MATEVIPGLEGVAIAESGVSFVDGKAGKLEYRGISVEDLAELSTFEETSYLLLYGHLPTRSEFAEFNRLLSTHRRLKYRIVDLMKCLPETGHPMDALQACAAAIVSCTARSGATEPSQAVPAGVSRPKAKVLPVAASATSARSPAMDSEPPPSTRKPNLPGSAFSPASFTSACSSAAAIGRTSHDSVGSSPANGETMTLRRASLSSSRSIRPSAHSAS